MIKTGVIKRVRTVIDAQKRNLKTIGLVPTMGAFHGGHLSLIRKARAECDYVVVSIFVNPAQFGPGEDYAVYPRDIKRDLKLSEENGADMVFAPSVETIYPPSFSSFVEVEKITEMLEGEIRPSHFRGVTTIVNILFNIISPDKAYFGQKDAQQLAVIRKMVREMQLPVKIVGCPTVRDGNGIALSSRHQYLDENHFKKAAGIYAALNEGARLIKTGVSDFGIVKGRITDILNNYGLKRIDYVSFNKWDSLEPLRKPDGDVLISLAVRLGNTRLIDNIIIRTPKINTTS
jgi:pantoate--beta-alanine ligase